MNATRQRPEHQHTDKTNPNMAGGCYRWFDGRRGNDARQERRVQRAGVAENRGEDESGGIPDRRVNNPRIQGASIGKKMRRKIIGWINDPNVLLPVLAFCVVMLTTLMTRAGVL